MVSTTWYLRLLWTHFERVIVDGGGIGGPNGGVGAVPLHTDATVASTWETFRLILQPGSPGIGESMTFALQTCYGQYLTAVDGGGIPGPNDETCPIHSDATSPRGWELFTLLIDDDVQPPTVNIKIGNNFLTAVNGGGMGGPFLFAQPLHTDATVVSTWERFTFV